MEIIEIIVDLVDNIIDFFFPATYACSNDLWEKERLMELEEKF